MEKTKWNDLRIVIHLLFACFSNAYRLMWYCAYKREKKDEAWFVDKNICKWWWWLPQGTLFIHWLAKIERYFWMFSLSSLAQFSDVKLRTKNKIFSKGKIGILKFPKWGGNLNSKPEFKITNISKWVAWLSISLFTRLISLRFNNSIYS